MKTPNQGIDEPVAHIPKHARRKNLNGFLAGAATMALLGVGGFLVYQAMDLGQANLPFNLPTNRSRDRVAPSPASDASPSPATIPTSSNPYIQSALNNKAQVEILSVKRIPEMPDEVSVEFRVNRVADKVATTDTINIGTTKARNPVTNETYKSVDPQQRSSGPIALFTLRQGQPLDGYVVLKVPRGITLIDVLVENTGAFRNVLVADGEPAIPAIPAIPTPTPTATPSISPFGKAPAIKETIPIPGTATPVFPSPRTTTIAPEASENQPLDSPATKPDNKGSKREDIRGQNTSSGSKNMAFGNKAQVELLSVQRQENPQSGKSDFVALQMRIRRVADEVGRRDAINIPQITARNSVSDTTYKTVSLASSTGSIPLDSIPRGESVDASVVLKVPEGVQIVDLYVPETGTFREVQITRSSPLE